MVLVVVAVVVVVVRDMVAAMTAVDPISKTLYTN